MSAINFSSILNKIKEEVIKYEEMNENELYGVFDKSGFFEYLGYKQVGRDIRKQFTVEGKRKIADYICLDEFHNVIFVIEAKKPLDKKLDSYLDDLWNKYVIPLKAKYGILTNGENILVYRRLFNMDYVKEMEINLFDITDIICDNLYLKLKKPEYNVLNRKYLIEYFKNVDNLMLVNPIAKNFFYETYQLSEDSIFGLLVKDLLKLFDYYYNGSTFLQGAFNFWKNSLANKPSEIPENWAPFLKKKEDIFKFMFILETAHAFVGRMIIAKACEDLDFPMVNISNLLVDRIDNVRDNIPIIAYPIIITKIIRDMRDQLIYSIFEEDIFSWWEDVFKEYNNKTPAELLNLEYSVEIDNISNTMAKFILVLYKFSFKEIAGDLLGDLYQQYFDRETRRALGEFYTPIEVVNYMLDEIKYINVKEKRLLDPACGSGTFLVEALKRYIKEVQPEAATEGWAKILRDLCNKPKIIGLDIHPFACLMAQIRFMIELMPYYKQAIEEEKLTVLLSLQRLPIFRTDSLVIEMIPPEISKKPTFNMNGEDISFSLDLPILNTANFERINVIIPSWRKVSHDIGTELYNFDEYFCIIQSIFDSIKNIYYLDVDELPVKNLDEQIKKYLLNKDTLFLSNYFKKYGDNILKEIRRIQRPYENGRLLKTIEDSVLSSFIKNYMKYDFVVGNPPYVKTQTFSTNKKYLRKAYPDTIYKNFDLYIPFIQRGIDWLNVGGKFSYICSNMFINRDYGEKLRSYILKKCDINQILNFGACDVFKEVTNYPCIFIFSKKTQDNNLTKIIRVAKKKDDLLNYVKNINKNYSDSYLDIFYYKQKSLTEKSWTLMPEEELNIFLKIKNSNSSSLKRIVHDVYGIKEATRTGMNEVFIINKEIISKYNIEQSLIIPKIKGSGEIKRWALKWDGTYIIFPYSKSNNKYNVLDIENYPNFQKYVLPFKDKLEKRRLFKKTILEHGKKWYELWNPLPYQTYKIIYPEISKHNQFAIDIDNYYCVGKNFIIYLNSQKLEDYLVLTAILNSKIIEYYFKHYTSVKRGFYYEYMGNVGDLPVIKINDIVIHQKIVELMTQIMAKSNLLNFDKFFINEVNKTTREPIETYELKNNYAINHDELKINKAENIYKVLMGDKEVISTSYEKESEYVMYAMNDKILQNIENKIIMPKNVYDILNNYDKIKKQYEETKNVNIKKIEEELNNIFYNLYNINKDEIIIIDNFIKKY